MLFAADYTLTGSLHFTLSVQSDRSALLGLTVVAQLRRLNRIAYFGSKDAKADVASLKTGQEKQHLELQNYLYEQTNLREEIRKCLQRE